MVSINWFDSGEYSKKYVTGIKALTYIRCMDFGSVYILRGFIDFARVYQRFAWLDFLIRLPISMNNFVRFFCLISGWSLLALKSKIRNSVPVLKLFWLMSLELRVASLCLVVSLDLSSLHMTSILVTPSMVVICFTICIRGRRIVIWLLLVIILVILVLVVVTLRILVLHSWVSFSSIRIFLRWRLIISVSLGIPGSSVTHLSDLN